MWSPTEPNEHHMLIIKSSVYNYYSNKSNNNNNNGIPPQFYYSQKNWVICNHFVLVPPIISNYRFLKNIYFLHCRFQGEARPFGLMMCVQREFANSHTLDIFIREFANSHTLDIFYTGVCKLSYVRHFYTGICKLSYIRHFYTGYDIFHCNSMKDLQGFSGWHCCLGLVFLFRRTLVALVGEDFFLQNLPVPHLISVGGSSGW